MIQTSRRGFLLGAGASLIAAPAVVQASSLMPISSRMLTPEWKAHQLTELGWVPADERYYLIRSVNVMEAPLQERKITLVKGLYNCLDTISRLNKKGFALVEEPVAFKHKPMRGEMWDSFSIWSGKKREEASTQARTD